MKKYLQVLSLKTSLCIIFFFGISKISIAQQVEIKQDAPEVIETIVLKFTDIGSAKVYQAVATTLSGTPGVTIKGHCPSADFLFLNVDKRYFPQNDELFKKIIDASFVFENVSKDVAKQIGICSDNELIK